MCSAGGPCQVATSYKHGVFINKTLMKCCNTLGDVCIDIFRIQFINCIIRGMTLSRISD